MTSSTASPQLALFGAPVDTGNLGVSALGESTIAAISQHRPGSSLIVFDNGRGRRTSRLDGYAFESDGAWISRRFHRSESLWTMAASARLRIPRNRNVETLRRTSLVMDISGGDSFTDLYGRKRWQLVSLPKVIALRIGVPLVLLPQTYGPFADPAHRSRAARIIVSAKSAWTRDPDGLEVLRELLGSDFDPARHREGVDVAFALPTRRPSLPGQLQEWLEGDASHRTLGLNVSGLLMNRPDSEDDPFELRLDYRRLVVELGRALLRDHADRLVLVPHVRGASEESDDRACARLATELDAEGRVLTLPAGLDASETKWCISRMDWFCGTRMHATIAALSSEVPAAAVAYSHKTRGVFATCGMQHAVVDARSTGTGDALGLLLERAEKLESDAEVLRERVPAVRERARWQFAEILAES